MAATLRVSKGTRSSLSSVDIVEGTLRFTTDTNELFVDMDNTNRVQISSFVTVETEFILANIKEPIVSKLYYVRETNTLYHYDKKELEWQPLGEGIYATLDKDGAVSKTKALSTSREFTFKGDASGSGEFDGTKDVSIELSLEDSGVVAGSYGEEDDKELSNGESLSIPYITFDSKGRAISVKNVTVRMRAISTVVANSKDSIKNTVVNESAPVHINTVAGGQVIDSFTISGIGGTTVLADENKNITIETTDGPDLSQYPQISDVKKIVNESIVNADLTKYAKIESPEFTGEPTAPTPDKEDRSDRIATTKFVESVREKIETHTKETIGTISTVVANSKDSIKNTEVGKDEGLFINTVVNDTVVSSISVKGSGGAKLTASDAGEITLKAGGGGVGSGGAIIGTPTFDTHLAGQNITRGELILLNKDDGKWYASINPTKRYLANGSTVIAISLNDAKADTELAASGTGALYFNYKKFRIEDDFIFGDPVYIRTSMYDKPDDEITLTNTLTKNRVGDLVAGYIRLGIYLDETHIMLYDANEITLGKELEKVDVAYMGAAYLGACWLSKDEKPINKEIPDPVNPEPETEIDPVEQEKKLQALLTDAEPAFIGGAYLGASYIHEDPEVIPIANEEVGKPDVLTPDLFKNADETFVSSSYLRATYIETDGSE